MVSWKLNGERGRSRDGNPVVFLRGLFLVLSCFVVLSLIVPSGLGPRAEGGTGTVEPDYPDLFDHIDRRLRASYLDLDRIQPRPLVERALSSLELSAEDIYVESFEPSKPYVAMHVDDNVEVLNLHDVKTREDSIRLLENVFEFVSRHYRGESGLNDLRYAAANGYLSGIDPHTLVFTPKHFEEFEIHIRGEIYGVGMMVGQSEDGKLEVKQVLKGTPAARAGFRNGDIISKIGDESTINMTVMEAVQKIRGPKDSEIVLTVKRASKTDKDVLETVDIAVKRDRVVIKSVESKLITDEELLGNGEPGGIEGGVGYVQVTNFDQLTTAALLKNLERLQEQNDGEEISGLILDLRGNSGGLLTQAVKMADIFLKSGDIVITAAKGDRLHRTEAENDVFEPDYPIVCLADEQSASGAEIVLGALQKNNRALVLGTRTFGKGSVQQLHGLLHGAQLKITVSEYLIPGEISIQENGVVPDVLAQPVTLDKDQPNLFPDKSTMKEKDYDTHIVSKYKTEEEPTYKLKYLYGSGEDAEDEPSASYRFIEGDLSPETDPLVKMALEVLRLAEEPYDPRRLLEEKAEAFANLEKQFYAGIVEKLEEIGIDWSAPEAGAPAVPEEKDLDLQLSCEIVEKPSKDKEDPVPVNALRVTTKLTNRGNVPLHRIKGITSSEYYLFAGREFLFGMLEPGGTITRTQDIRLPYFHRAQQSPVTLEISGPEDEVFLSESVDVELEHKERPAFAYSAELRNGNGQVVEKLPIGENATLALKIHNQGKGPAHKGVAILRNKTGREVFLKKGRIEFTDLEPGESEEVEFSFDVREGSPVELYEFELVIYDSYSGENLSRDIEVRPQGVKGSGFPNGDLFRPPVIDLAVGDQKPLTVTEADEVVLKATVESKAQNFKSWVTSAPLAPRSRTDKVYFARAGGKQVLDIRTEVPLADGLNVVTLVAKDSNGLENQRSVIVRKKATSDNSPRISRDGR